MEELTLDTQRSSVVGTLLELFVGGLADEDGPMMLGLHLDLQDVGRDVAAEIAWFDVSVDTLNTKPKTNKLN